MQNPLPACKSAVTDVLDEEGSEMRLLSFHRPVCGRRMGVSTQPCAMRCYRDVAPGGQRLHSNNGRAGAAHICYSPTRPKGTWAVQGPMDGQGQQTACADQALLQNFSKLAKTKLKEQKKQHKPPDLQQL